MAKMLANELFAMEACQKLLPKKAVQKSCSKNGSPSNCCLEKAAQITMANIAAQRDGQYCCPKAWPEFATHNKLAKIAGQIAGQKLLPKI